MSRTYIIVPTYNEHENIRAFVGAVYGVLPNAVVCVVDDNSPDGTARDVEELQKTFPSLVLVKREKKEGLGRAYIYAFEKILAMPDAGRILTMDADFSHHPSFLPRLLEAAKTDSDVVIGSRYVEGGRTIGWELWRKVLSAGGNLYCRFITGLPVNDCTAGFYTISTALLRKLDLKSIGASGYAFQIELKYALLKAGAALKEVPIVFANRIGGESKIFGSIISEGIITPWKIRFGKKK
jgi:dolichol-phosphate mannosyltransferase